MTDDPLSPGQRARIRRLSTPQEPQAGDEAGEINVVPYLDIIMNVMMFVLVSVSVAFASTINTSAAQAGTRPAPEGLRLTALITRDGVALKTAGGSVAPGCERAGPGVAVPNRDGDYDITALTACARRIKAAGADAAKETQVSVTASPDVPYQTVVRVMDGLRADGDGELFPEVSLGAVR